jgi:tight adherence protein B
MGSLIGLLFGGGLLLAFRASIRSQGGDSRFEVSERYWPQYCDDLSSAIRAGLSVSEATWQASGSLPSLLQIRFTTARTNCENGVAFNKSLEKLSIELDNSTFSRIVHLIITAQSHNTSAISSLLNEFSQNLRVDIALINEIAGKQAVTRVSAKVAAFAPLVVLILTSTRESVRQSFLSSTGLIIISAVMAVTLFSYLAMRRISQIKVLNV